MTRDCHITRDRVGIGVTLRLGPTEACSHLPQLENVGGGSTPKETGRGLMEPVGRDGPHLTRTMGRLKRGSGGYYCLPRREEGSEVRRVIITS